MNLHFKIVHIFQNFVASIFSLLYNFYVNFAYFVPEYDLPYQNLPYLYIL